MILFDIGDNNNSKSKYKFRFGLQTSLLFKTCINADGNEEERKNRQRRIYRQIDKIHWNGKEKKNYGRIDKQRQQRKIMLNGIHMNVIHGMVDEKKKRTITLNVYISRNY